MKNADKPAFPFVNSYGDDHEGLTKREKIAAMAMQGILSKQAGAGDQLGDLTNQNIDKVAKASTQFADALLTELESNDD